MTPGRKSIVILNTCFLIFIYIFFIILPSPSTASEVEVPDNIRVVVVNDAEELALSVKGPYEIRTIETDELLESGKTFFNITIRPSPYGILFGGKKLKIYAIHIIPKREPAIYLGKCLYRGSLQVIKTKKGLLKAVNVVGLEDYVKGVLYHEISHRWPMEAIKAQAIASRTFALYQARQNRNKDYYLTADASSQMYRGVYAEKYRTSKAVDQTRGEILFWKGTFLPAFFHATCGGHTEDVRQLWNVNAKPLRGVKCGYCENSPHFLWQCELPVSDIEHKLNKTGCKISKIGSIRILGKDRSGRITELAIRGEESKIKLSAKDFRSILGARAIRSTDFSVDIRGDTAYFKGKGWGHGVGMCQWGAFSMAKKNMRAKQILSFYYPGSEIVRLEE